MFACTLKTNAEKRSSVGSTCTPFAPSRGPGAGHNFLELLEEGLDAEVRERAAEEDRA
jgi:hypothetical protein